MEVKIVWTPQAILGLNKVLDYLESEWTYREIQSLQRNVQDCIAKISKHPDIFPSTRHKKHLHKALIDKNNYLVYRVLSESGIIEIINFRGTKQKPMH